jgi:DNA-binding transcriptional MocR family regulator
MTRYEQIVQRIENLVTSESLVVGEKVPSVREMRAKTGISVSTILKAYMLLEDRGIIEARPKSGYYVRPAIGEINWNQSSRNGEKSGKTGELRDILISSFIKTVTDSSAVQLSETLPSSNLLPSKAILRNLARVVRKLGPSIMAFEHPQGNQELRRQLAKRSTLSGMSLSSDSIVITNGGTDSWNLCIRVVAKPGETILLQSPSYFGFREIARNLGVSVIEITKNDLLDCEFLDSLFNSHTIKACVLMPAFSDPGTDYSSAEWKRIHRTFSSKNIPIIEDDVYGDLHFSSTRTPPLKIMDQKDSTFFCSSFSKTISPGFRISWVAVPEQFRETFLRTKFISSMSSSTLTQAVVADYLAHGGYDRHLRSMRRLLTSQLALYTDAIAKLFPEGTKTSRPRGGHSFWVRLPDPVDAVSLYWAALKENIVIAPGPVYSEFSDFNHFIRLSFGAPWTQKIERALTRLGQLAGK